MEIIITTADDAAAKAADAISAVVADKPDAVLGVATGSSPLGLYRELGRRVAAGRLSLARCSAFMLDEYVGLPLEHPESYHSVIARDLVAITDLDPARVHGPDGTAADIPVACAAYEQAIRDAGGVDVQIAGIGVDGHIGFNEPGSSLGSRTRIKTLTAQTRRDNARFFDGDVSAVPTHCLTQGVATIMDARRILLIALGREKAEAVRHMVEGPVSASCTASALQFHPHVTVVLDEGAASALVRADYYREVYANKPQWQS